MADEPIWYRVAGIADALPTIYLHGGPGYNSYSLEHSAGPFLEKKLSLVYLDQRGGGRSIVRNPDLLGISFLLDDIERIRKELSASKINFISHSFGGLLAVEYLRAHPKKVNKIVFVDIYADLLEVMKQQVHAYAEISLQLGLACAEKIKSLVRGPDEELSRRLLRIFDYLPMRDAHRHLLYASDAGQHLHNQLDIRSQLRISDYLWKTLLAQGYLDSRHSELREPLGVKALLLAGTHSRCIGRVNLERAADEWKIPLIFFENSGHFPFLEEPEKFSAVVADFLA